MKFIITLFLLFAGFTTFSLDIPETIMPKTRILRPLEWYAKQALLWEDQSMQEQTETAWLNYYMAARYALAPESELQRIETQINEKFQNTLTGYLVSSWNRGYTPEARAFLDKAVTVDREHVLINSMLAMHHELSFSAEARKDAVERVWLSNGISSSLMNYSYNLLMSVEPGSVLLTESENLTLPLFLLQDLFNVRKDVIVLNLDLLLLHDYRTEKFKRAGISLTRSIAEQEFPKTRLCEWLPEENPQLKFYYSLTLGQQNIASIKDQLYVVGLASQISKSRVDNISQIRENLENRFLLDYLTVDFNGESQYATGKVLSSNYLLPMLLLSEHYLKEGENSKQQKLESIINKIAEESGKSLLVRNFLGREKSKGWVFIMAQQFNTKAVEGSQRKIKDNVFASEYEVTNLEYQKFLDFLSENNLKEQLEVCKIDLSKYTEPALSFMKSYHLKQTPTKKEKYFTNYPVVNISYEAAMHYCNWLTQQYNVRPERKYKKVKFRLPSVDEWQVSAAGIPDAKSWTLSENRATVKIFPQGQELGKNFESKVVSLGETDILYPWFKVYNLRNSPLNHRGCSLGNFKWPDDAKPCVSRYSNFDGWLLMSPVGAYFPNDVGLYDVVGNVAEMTGEKGKACGGSWNHVAEESTIKSINTYEGPDASIGFRVFMEVIEE